MRVKNSPRIPNIPTEKCVSVKQDHHASSTTKFGVEFGILQLFVCLKESILEHCWHFSIEINVFLILIRFVHLYKVFEVFGHVIFDQLGCMVPVHAVAIAYTKKVES